MNVATLLHRSALRVPDRPAWIYADQQRSYATVRQRVAALAAGFRRAGLAVGDRLVLVLPNNPDLYEALWAGLWAGLTVVPINRHLHAHEVAYIAEHCGAAAVIVSEETYPATAELPATQTVIVTNSEQHKQLLNAKPASVQHVSLDTPAWLFYTSGTTGKPKGATLTHRNLLAMTLNYYADVDSIADDAVFLHAAPLTHGSGLYLLPAVGRGAVNVISHAPRFDPEHYLSLIDCHSVTHGAFLAPTMLRRVTEAQQRCDRELAHLRSFVIGGAPLYESDLQSAHETFGPIITQMYGQGEAPMTISVMTPRDLPRTPDDPRWQSCGRPFTGVEVRVLDDGDGTGEICVRGDVIMSGYWNDATATNATIVDDWLHTGDIGHFDEEGLLYLTDRAKDVIISGGSNVYPREVEEVLLSHKAISEAAVIGVPDQEWGESVWAYVVTTAPDAVSAADLVDYTTQRLASFKKPRQVIFVDQLPKSANGKILKRELREATA